MNTLYFVIAAAAYVAGSMLYMFFLGRGHKMHGARPNVAQCSLMAVLWPIWAAYDAGRNESTLE